jgi:hypothetical protein
MGRWFDGLATRCVAGRLLDCAALNIKTRHAKEKVAPGYLVGYLYNLIF